MDYDILNQKESYHSIRFHRRMIIEVHNHHGLLCQDMAIGGILGSCMCPSEHRRTLA